MEPHKRNDKVIAHLIVILSALLFTILSIYLEWGELKGQGFVIGFFAMVTIAASLLLYNFIKTNK